MLTLIVEDDALTAFALTEELELAGHRVVGPARSSGEAIALVLAKRPKLALIDLHLERHAVGLELARKLRQDFDMPIIFVTGDADVARAYADCALGVLIKPFETTEVAKIVQYVQARLEGEGAVPSPCAAFEIFH